ncbi:MAG: DUF4388 domain-containing protein [Bradymonadales bacterium]|nr:DUF4388 domain-containing protein [Bradymonadales bacterium]
MALTGTLQDVPLDELASLLQQQRRNGTLEISLPDGEVRILFRDGMICQVDDTRRPRGLLIGELLIEGQLITRLELANALDEQRSSAKPLGAILVAMGVLQIADLAKRLDLQFRESLFPLYGMTKGHFEFDPSISVPRILAPPPIPVEDVTMEAVRRIDELPEIESILPSPPPPFMRVADRSELPREGPLAGRLSEREYQVFTALAQGGTIEQLVGQTCLSSFDVKKALATLVKAGFVCPVQTGGTPSGSLPGVTTVPAGLLQRRRRTTRILFQVAFTLLLAITLVAIAQLIALRGSHPTEGSPLSFDTPFSAMRLFQTENHILRLEHAIELYRAEQGRYPANLTALIDDGLIEPVDLLYPSCDQDYYYRPSGEGYLLLPPKQ